MKNIIYIFLLLLLFSCGTKEVEPIKLATDGCSFCKMKIVDGKFGAELITSKGRVYKFDDMHCMISYHQENTTTKVQSFYIHDFNQNNVLVAAENAFYIKGGEINSPMHGNIIAVSTKVAAEELAKKFKATPISWSEINK